MDDVLAGLDRQLRSAQAVAAESAPEYQWRITWHDGDVHVLSIVDNAVVVTDHKTGQILTHDDHTHKDHGPQECAPLFVGDILARGLATVEGPPVEVKQVPGSPFGILGFLMDGATGQVSPLQPGGGGMPPELQEALRRLLGL